MERCFRSMKISCKKQGAVSHFRTEGDQTLIHYSVMLSPKVNVRTAHMPYTKVQNFLDMERFHEFSVKILVVSIRDTSFLICLFRLIINSLKQI